MSPTKLKKRSSILKKRQSSVESPEPTSTGKLPKRGILFSEKNKVREFIQCDEKTTIWGNSYETSIAKSEGSSDGSNASKKLSFDFSSSNIHTISVTSETNESEKENFILPNLIESNKGERKSGSSNHSSTNSSIENMTVDMHLDEMKRIKKYTTENLNVTNILQLDGTFTVKDCEPMILSPRKTLFFHEKSNLSVCLQEKVLMKPSDAGASNILVNCSDSIKLEDDEKELLRPSRKTIVFNDDMNISIGDVNKGKSSSQNVRQEKVASFEIKPKIFESQSKVSASNLKMFKSPVKAKVLQFSKILANESNMHLDSPPIKPPKMQNQKQVVNEIMEFIMTDTPIKKLCQQMGSSKKHNITPMQNPPPKVIFSSTKSNWNRHTSFIPTPIKSRSSSELLKSLGLDLESSDVNSPMDLEISKKQLTRKTMHQEQDIDETLQESRRVRAKLSRETLVGESNISIINKSETVPASLQSARKTLFGSEIDETLSQGQIADSKVEGTTSASIIHEHVAPTIYEDDDMELEMVTDGTAEMPIEPVYTNNDRRDNSKKLDDDVDPFIHVSGANASTFQNALQDFVNLPFINSLLNSSAISQTPETPLTDRSFDISLAIDFDNKTQNLHQNIDELLQRPSNDHIKAGRETIYTNNISIINESAAVPTLQKKSRNTLFGGEINQTITQDVLFEPKTEDASIVRKHARKTVYDEESMELEMVTKDTASMSNMSVYTNSGKRDDNKKSMNITDANLVSLLAEESNPFDHESCNNDSQMQVSLCVNAPSNHLDNLTLINPPLNSTSAPLTPDEMRRDQSSRYVKFNQESLVGNDVSINEASHVSLFQNSGRKTLFGGEVDEKPSHEVSPEFETVKTTSTSIVLKHVRETIYEDEDIPCARQKLPLRQTVYEAENMELEADVEEAENVPIEPSYKFVVNRDDSRKLMNITDAEIVSILDDESDPCLTVADESQEHVSFGANASVYQNALQDFVNITIMNSPLNASAFSQTPKAPFTARSREISSPTDYSVKFDELLETLEEKAVEKPRLEIDDFLEKLNIKPVMITFHPELQPDYSDMRMAEMKERLAREKAERKAAKVLQLPATPPYDELIKNKLACVDEEIEHELQHNLLNISPIFPEGRDFEFLLVNKFKTDEELVKVWDLDLQFSWMNQYKISHKLMEPFKLNIHLQGSVESVNDSTVPIYFDKLLMYTHPSYRGVLSKRLQFLKKEFRRAVGTDNFLPKCSSMSHLFTFMEYYHNQVIEAVTTVNNFFNIINKHKAVLEYNEFNVPYIFKRHFTVDGSDIVDVKIAVNETIDNVFVTDVSIKAWTSYAYQLKPRQNIANLKGLMLIEVVLFDMERLLQDNTERRHVE